jgi:hypothetical protein
MAGTTLDMTIPRPGSLSQVYALFGEIAGDATSLKQLVANGTVIKQIPVDTLVKLDSGGAILRNEALAEIGGLSRERYLGAAGYDDWWNGPLDILNAPFQLSRARRLVGDKAEFYRVLEERGVAVPKFIAGNISASWLEEARRTLGARPVLKPATGAGSRGVYRCRADISAQENVDYYTALRAQEKVDTSIATLVVEYIDAIEVSVDFLIIGTHVGKMVAHEKMAARDAHPFTDRIMVAPPVRKEITAALPGLEVTISSLAAVLPTRDAVVHAELRLRDSTWYVLDAGIRPGMGLVGHSFQAITGIDPRLVHLYASIGAEIPPYVCDREGSFEAVCIACCYVEDGMRSVTSTGGTSRFAAELRLRNDIVGWHLNTSEIDDTLYRPDAGLSLGTGGVTPQEAVATLRSIISRHSFTTA